MESLSPGGRKTRNKGPEALINPFQKFFEGWLVRQEHYLDELLTAQKNSQESREEDYQRELIARVLSHYQQYYEQKSKAVQDNVLLLFSPPWFSSLEKTFLWIAGFKPGLAFRLVSNSVSAEDMTSEQRQRMSQVKEETRVEERSLANEMAKIQESVAAPPLLEVLRRNGRNMDGYHHHHHHRRPEEEDAEIIDTTLRSALETLVGNADTLRITTAAKVAELLTPSQNVRFFLAVTQLQVNIRSWGLQTDADQLLQQEAEAGGWTTSGTC